MVLQIHGQDKSEMLLLLFIYLSKKLVVAVEWKALHKSINIDQKMHPRFVKSFDSIGTSYLFPNKIFSMQASIHKNSSFKQSLPSHLS